MELRSLPLLLTLVTLFSTLTTSLPNNNNNHNHNQQVLANIREQKPMHTTALLAGAAMAPTPPTPIDRSYNKKARKTRSASATMLRSRPLNMRHGIPPNGGNGDGEVEDREPMHVLEL